MWSNEGDTERRLRALELEVRRWRWGAVSVMTASVIVATVSCQDREEQREPTALELATSDGALRMRLDANGLRFEREGASALFSVAGVYVAGDEGAATVAPASVLLHGAGERSSSFAPDAMTITGDPGGVQIQGGELARVAVSSGGSRAELGAIGDEATLRIEGSDGAVHVRGVASPSGVGLSVTDANGTKRYLAE